MILAATPTEKNTFVLGTPAKDEPTNKMN